MSRLNVGGTAGICPFSSHIRFREAKPDMGLCICKIIIYIKKEKL